MWWTRTPIPPTDLLSHAVGRRRATQLRHMIQPPYTHQPYRITRTMTLFLATLTLQQKNLETLAKFGGALTHGTLYFTHPDPVFALQKRSVKFTFFLGNPLSWEEVVYLACITPEVLAQQAWKACGTVQMNLTHRQ